jgi:hypothetical protein
MRVSGTPNTGTLQPSTPVSTLSGATAQHSATVRSMSCCSGWLARS